MEKNIMQEDLKREKELIDKQHEKGYKVLCIGIPLAGKDVPKQTFISWLNMYEPLLIADLLVNKKIVTMTKVISNFPMDANRNKFACNCIETGVDYMLWLDMDQTFPADMISKMLEVISEDRPIVAWMYYLKREPYPPVLGRYVPWDEDNLPYKDYYKKMGFVGENDVPLMTYRPITYFDKTTPFTVDVIGLGCVIMKTEIFKGMTYPYFYYTPDPRPGKEFLQMDEVMPFCAQLKKLNIPIWIDPRVQCGHLANLETNVDLFEACRDTRFNAHAKEEPEDFDRISKLFIDVREEQKSHGRFEKASI
jgi:hypothetical protein